MADDIWGRLPCDTNESFEAFKAFRDSSPPRRLKNVVFASQADVSKWYREHDWHRRTAAYDAHLDEIVRHEREAILRQKSHEVTAHHLAILQNAREIVDIEFSRLLEMIRPAGPAPTLKVGDLTKLVSEVVKLERLVRGETTSNVGKVEDMSKLSEEELAAFGQMLDKIETAGEVH